VEKIATSRVNVGELPPKLLQSLFSIVRLVRLNST